MITIPLGWALMRARPGARIGLMVISALILPGSIYLIILQRSEIGKGNELAFEDAVSLATIAGMDLMAVWFLLGMFTHRVKQWFKAPAPSLRTSLHKGWGWILFCTILLSASRAGLLHHQAADILQTVFPVDTTVSFQNAVTGEPLPMHSCSIQSHTRGRIQVQQISTMLPDMGLTAVFRGLSNIPVRIFFEAPGFEPEILTIEKESPAELTLKLTPAARP